ncbi:MAG: hypothetical protein WA130_06280 [Candidatus Methanoperedens sp.]
MTLKACITAFGGVVYVDGRFAIPSNVVICNGLVNLVLTQTTHGGSNPPLHNILLIQDNTKHLNIIKLFI